MIELTLRRTFYNSSNDSDSGCDYVKYKVWYCEFGITVLIMSGDKLQCKRKGKKFVFGLEHPFCQSYKLA